MWRKEDLIGKRVYLYGEWGTVIDFQPRIDPTRIVVEFDDRTGDYPMIEVCTWLFENLVQAKKGYNI